MMLTQCADELDEAEALEKITCYSNIIVTHVWTIVSVFMSDEDTGIMECILYNCLVPYLPLQRRRFFFLSNFFKCSVKLMFGCVTIFLPSTA